jgi:hypothetical protein
MRGYKRAYAQRHFKFEIIAADMIRISHVLKFLILQQVAQVMLVDSYPCV